MHYVYILKNMKDQGFYIGCTSDVERRLKEHSNGKTDSLRGRRPLEIVYVEKYDKVGDAYLREKQIKSYKGGVAFKKLIFGGFA